MKEILLEIVKVNNEILLGNIVKDVFFVEVIRSC